MSKRNLRRRCTWPLPLDLLVHLNLTSAALHMDEITSNHLNFSLLIFPISSRSRFTRDRLIWNTCSQQSVRAVRNADFGYHKGPLQ
jgi:hypothetical protein